MSAVLKEGESGAPGDGSGAAAQPETPRRTLRPRDAASLILIDRRNGVPHLLMGRRSLKHVFMPGRLVFPGGRTDPTDSRVPVATPLHPAEEARLIGTGSRATAARARAIALSALRETYEEAGILIGRRTAFATRNPGWSAFAAHGVQPSLKGLRYIARAVTPPGGVRRFDTRFLALWRNEVAVELPGGGPTNELEELVWLPIGDALRAELHSVTRMILTDLETRLAADPDLNPGGGGSIPHYVRGSSGMKRIDR